MKPSDPLLLADDTLCNWPNSLDGTDLNWCGARRDAGLCRLCYKQTLCAAECILQAKLPSRHLATLSQLFIVLAPAHSNLFSTRGI